MDLSSTLLAVKQTGRYQLQDREGSLTVVEMQCILDLIQCSMKIDLSLLPLPLKEVACFLSILQQP